METKGDGAARYCPQAENLAEGRGFSRSAGPPYTPECKDVPGFAALLSAIHVVLGVRALPVVHLCFEILGLLLLVQIARSAGDRLAGLLAVGIAWVVPVQATYLRHALSQPLATFLALGLCAVLLLARSSDSRWPSVAAGLLASGLCLVRVDFYPFVAVSAAFIVLPKPWTRQGWQKAGLYVAAFLSGLAPWALYQEGACGALELPGAKQFSATVNPYFRWLDTWIDDPRQLGPYVFDALQSSNPPSYDPRTLPNGEERAEANRAIRLLRAGDEAAGQRAFAALADQAPMRRSVGKRLMSRVKRTALTLLLVPSMVPAAAPQYSRRALYGAWATTIVLAPIALYGLIRAPKPYLILLALLAASRLSMPFAAGWAAQPPYLLPAVPAIFALAGAALAGLLTKPFLARRRRNPFGNPSLGSTYQ